MPCDGIGRRAKHRLDSGHTRGLLFGVLMVLMPGANPGHGLFFSWKENQMVFLIRQERACFTKTCTNQKEEASMQTYILAAKH